METCHASKFQSFKHEIQINKVVRPIACDQTVLLPFLRAPPEIEKGRLIAGYHGYTTEC